MTAPRFDFDDRPDARYCPSCGGAFRPEIDRCPRCDQRLLFRAEAEKLVQASAPSDADAPSYADAPQPQAADVALTTLGDPLHLEVVCRALEQAGIPHRVDRLSAQFGVPGSNLYVAPEHVLAARGVIADLEVPLADAAPDADPGADDMAEETEDEEARAATSEKSDPDQHPLSRRSLRFRLLRESLLVAAASYLFLAAVAWDVGSPIEAAIDLLLGLAFVAIRVRARRAPSGAFAAAMVLATILLVLDVLVGLLDPALRAAPGAIFTQAIWVVTLYWGWQSSPAELR